MTCQRSCAPTKSIAAAKAPRSSNGSTRKASAKTTYRRQLQNLLKHCRTRKGKVHFVIVYNLTRFARETYDHFALRAHLKSLRDFASVAD